MGASQVILREQLHVMSIRQSASHFNNTIGESLADAAAHRTVSTESLLWNGVGGTAAVSLVATDEYTAGWPR